MLVAPAFATVGETNFNTNQTGVSSCEIGVLGVDENTANANAQWSTNSYTCPAGTYLPDGDTWSSDSQYGNNNCAACTSGSYCGGGTLQYSEANDVGITACPTGYTNSAANATAQSECYRTCAAADVPHLKSGGTMTGGYYYGDNNQCGPANAQQCAGGYHYVAGFNPATDNLPATTDYDDEAMATSHIARNNGGKYCDLENLCQENSDWTAQQLSAFASTGIQNNEWRLTYGNGSVTGELRGMARCSTHFGPDDIDSTPSHVETSTNVTAAFGTGGYCWCKPTSWTATGGTMQSLSSSWLLLRRDGDATDCADICAISCAEMIGTGDTEGFWFRSAVFNAITKSPAQCTANTITLNWKNATGGTHATTQCTYGGTIDTPTTAPTKRGHTFTGWRFVAPSGN